MSPAPTVLYPLTLPGLLHYLLTTQSDTCPTLLIVCSSRDVFIQDLASSLQNHDRHDTHSLEQLVAPTLHNLLTTRHVKLAFCASVQALLAYLTAYGRSGTNLADEADERERVVLVNPLALHAPTSFFSAQGLSRCFAAAAEDPWEQEISILNVSARRFGSGSGERAWAGRTTRAKWIAARWFLFHSLENQQPHADQG